VSEDRENVLQTIWSRCQPLHIRAIENSEMVSAIQQAYHLDQADAQSYAHVANGSYTKAIELIAASDETKFFFDLFVKMMRSSVSGNIKAIKETANELAGIGREMQKSFLLYALRMFREYFVSNLHEPEMVYLNEDERTFGERFAPYINERNIEAFNEEFTLAHRQIEQNGNAKIIFLDVCLKVTVL